MLLADRLFVRTPAHPPIRPPIPFGDAYPQRYAVLTDSATGKTRTKTRTRHVVFTMRSAGRIASIGLFRPPN
jgi:hypothetical protein